MYFSLWTLRDIIYIYITYFRYLLISLIKKNHKNFFQKSFAKMEKGHL